MSAIEKPASTDLGWCLTAKEPDMAYTYRWKEKTHVSNEMLCTQTDKDSW